MKRKRCSKCRRYKSPHGFPIQAAGKGGFCAVCKACKNKSPSRATGTLAHFQLTRWNGMNRRTVNGSNPNYKDRNAQQYLKKRIRLAVTKEEFYGWCQEHATEILSLYESGSCPSIDRIDPSGHYILDNLRIVSKELNTAMGRATVQKRYGKPVIGIHKLTGHTVKFQSINEAERIGGFNHSHILGCLNGGRKTHGGYTWSLA